MRSCFLIVVPAGPGLINRGSNSDNWMFNRLQKTNTKDIAYRLVVANELRSRLVLNTVSMNTNGHWKNAFEKMRNTTYTVLYFNEIKKYIFILLNKNLKKNYQILYST